MIERLHDVWNRQMYQIKQLTFSSVVFMVELYETGAKVVASTDNAGYDYDVNKSISKSEFGLDKVLQGLSSFISNGKIKYEFKSSLSVPIVYVDNIIWGAIILLSDKPNAFNFDTEHDIQVFAQSVTNQIKIDSLENSIRETSDYYSDSALNFFLKSINGVPWRLNFNSKEFIYLGLQAESILGYGINDWPTLDAWSNTIFTEDRQKIINNLFDMSMHGDEHAMEYRIVKKNGEIIWIKDIVKVITDSKNNAKELFGVMINITHTKKNEQNYSALNNQLKYILNATNTALSIVDNNCNIIFHSHKDISTINSPCYEYFSNRKSECDNCPRLKNVKTKCTYVEKINDKTYQVTAFPFEVDLNNWNVAEIRIDITDRVLQENEIIALKEMLEFSMDAGNIGFFDYKMEERKFKTNKVFKNITGYDLDDNIVEIDWVISRFHPDDIEKVNVIIVLA